MREGDRREVLHPRRLGGVLVDGRETYAGCGVTSLAHPLSINKDTHFMIGSITKTFLGATPMSVVAEGKVDLHAPVRKYVPELRLAGEETAATMTVLNLAKSARRTRSTDGAGHVVAGSQ